jgi:hypothetical protein
MKSQKLNKNHALLYKLVISQFMFTESIGHNEPTDKIIHPKKCFSLAGCSGLLQSLTTQKVEIERITNRGQSGGRGIGVESSRVSVSTNS